MKGFLVYVRSMAASHVIPMKASFSRHRTHACNTYMQFDRSEKRVVELSNFVSLYLDTNQKVF